MNYKNVFLLVVCFLPYCKPSSQEIGTNLCKSQSAWLQQFNSAYRESKSGPPISILTAQELKSHDSSQEENQNLVRDASGNFVALSLDEDCRIDKNPAVTILALLVDQSNAFLQLKLGTGGSNQTIGYTEFVRKDGRRFLFLAQDIEAGIFPERMQRLDIFEAKEERLTRAKYTDLFPQISVRSLLVDPNQTNGLSEKLLATVYPQVDADIRESYFETTLPQKGTDLHIRLNPATLACSVEDQSRSDCRDRMEKIKSKSRTRILKWDAASGKFLL
ncbi:MAG: hypothetical protein JNM27_09660 [Leptospirales bacterium]|nr:hypothetical protein [Leptospirales bacterium]